MTAPGDDDTSADDTIDGDGSQQPAEGSVGGGRSTRGPSLSAGGEQEPGGLVPPYEGRTEGTDSAQDVGSMRGGVRVGGATGAVEDDEFKAPDPAETSGGRTASPGDEQPAAEMADGTSSEQGVDLTSHVPGTPAGEKGGA